jgi:hypothetical protein
MRFGFCCRGMTMSSGCTCYQTISGMASTGRPSWLVHTRRSGDSCQNMYAMSCEAECVTYDRDIDLQRCTYPQRICEPSLIVRVNQALPDKVRPDHTGNRDDNASGQQNANTNALLQGHTQAQNDWYG